MSLPNISVIIPTYNRRNLLAETLRSLESSMEKGLEVIVVDDGSTDDSLELINSMKQVNLLQQANSGPLAARNLGVSKANGEYIAFLDSDDLWFPWTYDIYREVIGRCNASFIAGKPFVFEDVSELSQMKEKTLEFNSFPDYLASGDEWRWWGCSSFVIRKSTFNKVGGFARGWINAEDADLALRLGIEPGFIQITSPSTFAYRQHAVSEMKNDSRNIDGAFHLLNEFMSDRYSGADARKPEQFRIVSRHLRPVILNLLRNNKRSEAWFLYRKTFRWHLKLCRFKFLAGFLWEAIR